jgi:hypothetical protein
MGEWQDETKGDYIVEGVYGGPKQKVTRTAKGNEKHVVRGFNTRTLDVRNLLNLEDFGELVKKSIVSDIKNEEHKPQDDSKTSISVKQSTIKRQEDGDMFNIEMTKTYSVRQSKRKSYDIERVGEYYPLLCSTLPFGYEE